MVAASESHTFVGWVLPGSEGGIAMVSAVKGETEAGGWLLSFQDWFVPGKVLSEDELLVSRGGAAALAGSLSAFNGCGGMVSSTEVCFVSDGASCSSGMSEVCSGTSDIDVPGCTGWVEDRSGGVEPGSDCVGCGRSAPGCCSSGLGEASESSAIFQPRIKDPP